MFEVYGQYDFVNKKSYIFRRDRHNNKGKMMWSDFVFHQTSQLFISRYHFSFISFYIFFISYLSVRVIDDSFAVRFVAHFWSQAWCLLEFHGDPFMWLVSILLPDLRSHGLLSQVLRLIHVRVNEDHVLHVVDSLAPLLVFLLSHRHAFGLRCGGVTSSTSWRRLQGWVNIRTVSHWCLHGSYSHGTLNWIVYRVERRFLCHVCVARASLPTSHASSLRLQMAGLLLTHLNGFENRVL